MQYAPTEAMENFSVLSLGVLKLNYWHKIQCNYIILTLFIITHETYNSG